jgi:tetratricopeptide (TPR) repeat protein
MTSQPPWRTLPVLGAVLVALTSVALPQQPAKRPQLPAGADTNDANSYYQYGVAGLRERPGAAAQAFFWAHRLSPDWADPLYGQWVATLLRSSRLPEYLDGDRNTVRSKEYRSVDSLLYAALALNPFIYRRFDRMLFDEYIQIYARRYEARTGRILNRAILFDQFREDVLSDNPSLWGWMQYAEGRWAEATEAYNLALKRVRHPASVLASRARVSFLKNDYPAALADMQAALEDRQKIEEKDLVYFYDSKAVFHHSIGVLYELMKDPASAREAYASALQEDLSYHQGHVRLAALALEAGDTATAISEYDLAAQIRENDPVVRYQLGVLLRKQGRCAEAVEHFKAAIAADSLFAPPYVELGQAYETLAQPDEARAQYHAFIAHAAHDDADLTRAGQRLEALKSR